MTLKVVGPVFWTEIVARALVASPQKAMAFAMLRSLHSRGCGVPPDLCVSFAEWCYGGSNGAWPAIWSELAEPLGRARRPATDLGAPPLELLKLLLAPMAFQVTERMAFNVVFAGDGYPDHLDDASFSYERHAETFVAKLYTQARERAALAWQAINGTSTQRSHDAAWHAVVDSRLTDRRSNRIDGLGLQLFLSARSPDAVTAAQNADLTPPVREAKVRAGLRPQQDSVLGFRRTSSLEDVSAAVAGQMAGPKPLIALRLFEEGYTAYDRPPPSVEPREVLLVALAPEATEGTGLSILRAAWWLFAKDVIAALKQRKITSVDVAWVQSCHGVQAGSCRLSVRDSDDARSAGQRRERRRRIAMTARPDTRAAFLQQIAEMPDYHTPFVRGVDPIAATPRSDTTDAIAALSAFLTAGQDRIGYGATPDARINTLDYSDVITVFCIGEPSDSDADTAPLRHQLERTISGAGEVYIARYGAGRDGVATVSLQGSLRGVRPSARAAHEELRAEDAVTALAGYLMIECLEGLQT